MSMSDLQGKQMAKGTSSFDTSYLNAEWLANLNHELRSPLAAIQGYTSLLLLHGSRIALEEQKEFLLQVRQQGKRMETVLEHMLDIAQLESGTTYLHLLPLNMLQFVQYVLHLFEGQQMAQPEVAPMQFSLMVQQEPLPATTDVIDQSLFTILADSTLLQKMLFHLLDNAEKYTRTERRVEVVVSAYAPGALERALFTHIPAQMRYGDQPWIKLCIQDHGIGIPKQEQERIFERFQRLDMNLNRSVTGLGLGLTICKYIVDLHHGAIWVESTPDVGSTFCVLLPAQGRSSERVLSDDCKEANHSGGR